MARLGSWLSTDVTHALAWALIHSLWQCLGLAALAAILMAFSRRPPIRYLVATVVLVAMLAAPVATFLVLMKPAAPVHVRLPVRLAPQLVAMPAALTPSSAAYERLARVPAAASSGTTIGWNSPKRFLPSRLLSPDFLSWLVGAWFCGVALFSLRLAGGLLLLERKRPGQFSDPGPRILALCRELQHQLGLHRAIRYLECSWLQAPAVIGWVRPIVLLPVSALTGLSEAQLRAVIAHELAHIRRLDAFVNLLQLLVETLLFYHPAIWWLNRRIRAERELCCDEIAVSLTGNRLEYAKALTLMAEWERAPVLAMAANRGPLSQRIFHILGKTPLGAGRRMLGLTGGILLFAMAMGGADALFGIAFPIPMAHVQASFKPALASSRIAVDHIAELVYRAGGSAPKNVSPDQSIDNVVGRETVAPGKTEATVSSQAQKLVAPSRAEKLMVHLADLLPLLPTEAPLTPLTVASNEPLTLPAQPASSTLPAVAAQVTAQPNAPMCVLPTIAHTADLQAVPGSDLRIVPVAINGQSKRFLLDIGTNSTEISQAAVADLGLPDAKRSTDSIFVNYLQPVAVFDVKGSHSADDYRPHVRVASFTLGDATSPNLAFAVAMDPAMGKTKPYDGIITGNFFRQYDVELDFVQNKLNYLAPTSCADPDQMAYWPHAAVAIIPMTNLDGKIQVEVSIQGQAIPAVIDTASPHTVMRRDIAELMLGLKPGTPDMVADDDVRDGTGLQVYRHTFSQIAFPGGVTAYNVPAFIQTSSMIRIQDRTPILGSRAQFTADPRQRIPSLTLGMDVLRQLHLHIAYGQQKLYVTAAQ